MKNNIRLIIILFFLFGGCIVFKSDDSKFFKVDGIKYSVSVNGSSQDSFPAKGPYHVDIECNNASASWNYDEWVAEVYDVTDSLTCDLEFTSFSKVNMSNYIMNLIPSGQTSVSVSTKATSDGSTLEKITEHGEIDYRYSGLDPNNYILFNRELWRIIGVFDQNSHGISGKSLVKIIRNDSIGQYVFDSASKNNFPTSDIYEILNTAYYNHIDGTGATYCYAFSTSEPAKCDFTRIGIQSEFQNMVEIGVNWFLGSVSLSGNIERTKSEMYTAERSSTVRSGNSVSTYAAGLTNTPVGLMYVSDYGYAAMPSCTMDLAYYENNYSCNRDNWLNSNSNEFFITHNAYSTSWVMIHAAGTGQVEGGYTASSGFSIRPTLYLKENVFRISGTGTQTDPYIIGI